MWSRACCYPILLVEQNRDLAVALDSGDGLDDDSLAR